MKLMTTESAVKVKIAFKGINISDIFINDERVSAKRWTLSFDRIDDDFHYTLFFNDLYVKDIEIIKNEIE